MRLSETPLFPAEQIQRRVAELGAAISKDFDGRELVVVVVLKGSIVFASDLIRHLKTPLLLEFIRARSYTGANSGGRPEFTLMPEESLKGKHVLLVEDILDTGTTTARITQRLNGLKPASLSLCVLLDKPPRRRFAVTSDYTGFTIDEQFVVGYGLDYNERFRELPDIHALAEDPRIP